MDSHNREHYCSFLGPVLFNTLIDDSDEKLQKIFLNFKDDTKLAGISNNPEDRNNILNDLESLEK